MSALLEARDVHLSLPDHSSEKLFGRAPDVHILKGVSLSIKKGESLGIVGESGSGKTSLGRTLIRLYEPNAGQVLFEGSDITHLPESELRPLRARMQFVFQDPLSSLNPRHRICDILAQPLIAYDRVSSRAEAQVQVRNLLERVRLPAAFASRYPHELSGGQRQRVGIARAIALRPSIVIADEIVSGLDVSTQAQILGLLKELKTDDSLIFISHDLSVVRALCDRVVVMHRGLIVEQGKCDALFAAPQHDYTRALLDAIPLPDFDPHWIDQVTDGR